MNKMGMSHATALALLAAASYTEAAPSRRRKHNAEEPRREPVKQKPQKAKPVELTDDDHARIQAAADRRAKRNAKHKGE